MMGFATMTSAVMAVMSGPASEVLSVRTSAKKSGRNGKGSTISSRRARGPL